MLHINVIKVIFLGIYFINTSLLKIKRCLFLKHLSFINQILMGVIILDFFLIKLYSVELQVQ